MRQITVVVHHEDGSWWAESADLPGFSALADTLDELRVMIREGVSYELDGELVLIRSVDTSGVALDAASAFAAPFSAWWSESGTVGAGLATIFGRSPSGAATAVPAPV